MPIGRYFLYIGSALLALLLIADWYSASPSTGPAASESAASRNDRYSIRIRSAHKWPQAVVIDTTLPTIVPPPVTAVAAKAPEARPPSEAFAMAIEPVPLPVARPAKPAKRHVRRTNVARAANDRMISNGNTFGFRDDWFAPRRREASASRRDGFGPRGFWPRSW